MCTLQGLLLILTFNIGLEAANLALQNHVEATERKVTAQQTALKNLTRERDSAVSQLGVAFFSSQELKTNNDQLKDQNEKLRRQLSKLLDGDTRKSRRHEDNTARSQERDYTDRQSTTKDVAGITGSEYATHQSIDEHRQSLKDRSGSTRQRSQPSVPDEPRHRVSGQIDEQISKLNRVQEDDSLFSIDLPSILPSALSKRPNANSNSTSKKPAPKKPNTGKQRAKRVVVEDIETDEDDEGDMEAVTGEVGTQPDADQDLTFLSFIDVRLLLISLFLYISNHNDSHRAMRLRASERLLRKREQLANALARSSTTTPKPTLWHPPIPQSMLRPCHANPP